MGGEVERVRRHVLTELAGKPRQTEGQPVGNSWGSMPSDQMAAAAITAMGLAEAFGDESETPIWGNRECGAWGRLGDRAWPVTMGAG
jgi:hypothetical protein